MRRTVTSGVIGLAAVLLMGAAVGINANQVRTSAVSATNMTGVTASEGTSVSLARADHGHSITGTLPQTNGGTGAGALTCTTGQHLTSNGTAYSCSADTGGTVAFDALANPTGDSAITVPLSKKVLWTFTGNTDDAFSVHGDGAFGVNGHLVHFDVASTTATAGSDVLHITSADLDTTGIYIEGATSAANSIVATGVIRTTGGFVGSLTGTATGYSGTLPLAQITDDGTSGKCLLSGGGGGDPAWTACPGGAPTFSGLTAGGFIYADSTTTVASTGAGTSGSSVLFSGGAGAPSWKQGVFGVNMTQDRATTSSTGSTTTDLTWDVGANQGQNFTCNLTSTGSASSKTRYAIAGPASMTYVACKVLLSTTSTTTLVHSLISAQWASTCTGCTNAVTSTVQTGKLTDVLSCNVTNGNNAGSITIYFAASTNGQTNTLHKGSGCMVSTY
jgi:hypothetical protein